MAMRVSKAPGKSASAILGFVLLLVPASNADAQNVMCSDGMACRPGQHCISTSEGSRCAPPLPGEPRCGSDCLRAYVPTASPLRIALGAGQTTAAHAELPPAAEAPVALPQVRLAAATNPTALHDLESEITFNVLDHAEIDRQTGKLILMGHSDASYATARIPYLQYLATLLDNPNPEFSLEWTSASEARVAELRRRLSSDDEWRRLAGEWGRWIDDSERITDAGRFFMPLFGIETPAGPKMDRYQVLAGVFRAIGERQAADILAAFGDMHRAMPNLTIEHLYRLFRAAGVFDVFRDARSEMQAGRMTEEQVMTRVYRAMFANFDSALKYSGNPTSTAFENALRRGLSANDAMEAATSEFDRQLRGVYGEALRRLYRSKPEIQVPVTLVNPSWRDALNVEPRYIGVKSSSLLAKLLLDADRAAKTLINMPELAGKIPGYETQFAYRMNRGSSRGSDRVSSARLWISVEHIDASQSTDGNILALGEAKMRFNMRELGQGGRDLPGQRPGEYEKLLTSLYDGFARHYSPVFHELREAAKLAYVAQWLKNKNAAFQMPAAALDMWQGPAAVPGVIFITWSPDPSRPDVQTVSAIGGVSLRVPPPGSPVCVKFCDDQIPKDKRIQPVSSLSRGAVSDLMSSGTQAARSFAAIVGLYLSNFHNPFEAYASAETVSYPEKAPKQPPAVSSFKCDGKEHCKEIDCDGNTGIVRASVFSQLGSRRIVPFILVKYDGTNAADLKWIQFIWFEILIREKAGDTLKNWGGVGVPVNTTNGPMWPTTDPIHPNYRVDSIDPFNPYYGGANRVPFPDLPPFMFARLTGWHARDATSEVMVDQPGSGIHLVPDDLHVYEVQQHDHFDDFLVSKTGKVCAKISWAASFVSSRTPSISSTSRERNPTYEITAVNDSGRPEPAQVEQLRKQYPHYPSDRLH